LWIHLGNALLNIHKKNRKCLKNWMMLQEQSITTKYDRARLCSQSAMGPSSVFHVPLVALSLSRVVFISLWVIESYNIIFMYITYIVTNYSTAVVHIRIVSTAMYKLSLQASPHTRYIPNNDMYSKCRETKNNWAYYRIIVRVSQSIFYLFSSATLRVVYFNYAQRNNKYILGIINILYNENQIQKKIKVIEKYFCVFVIATSNNFPTVLLRLPSSYTIVPWHKIVVWCCEIKFESNHKSSLLKNDWLEHSWYCAL